MYTPFFKAVAMLRVGATGMSCRRTNSLNLLGKQKEELLETIPLGSVRRASTIGPYPMEEAPMLSQATKASTQSATLNPTPQTPKP